MAAGIRDNKYSVYYGSIHQMIFPDNIQTGDLFIGFSTIRKGGANFWPWVGFTGEIYTTPITVFKYYQGTAFEGDMAVYLFYGIYGPTTKVSYKTCNNVGTLINATSRSTVIAINYHGVTTQNLNIDKRTNFNSTSGNFIPLIGSVSPAVSADYLVISYLATTNDSDDSLNYDAYPTEDWTRISITQGIHYNDSYQTVLDQATIGLAYRTYNGTPTPFGTWEGVQMGIPYNVYNRWITFQIAVPPSGSSVYSLGFGVYLAKDHVQFP